MADDETAEATRPGEELDEQTPAIEAAPPTPDLLVTEDRQLQLSDAQALAARRGLSIVLFAGPTDAGKTTLLVKIWSSFLADPILGGARFAGSWTSLGFERRDFQTRAASKRDRPAVPRTRQEDDGFLHLRVSDGQELRELLLSDMAGETFDAIVNGATFSDELDWSSRISCALVCVSADAISNGATRSKALSAARLVLRHLRNVDPAPRVAVTLTKADALSGDAEDRWKKESAKLLTLAAEIDPNAAVLTTAALPADGAPSRGLDAVVDWILEKRRTEAVEPADLPRAKRTAGRLV